MYHLPPTPNHPKDFHYGDAGYDVRVQFRSDVELNKRLQPEIMRNRLQFSHAENNSFKVTVRPGDRVVLPTNLCVSCPPDIALKFEPRSSLAKNHGVELLAGLVDSNYRNEVMVILKNGGVQDVTFVQNERVAQIVPYKISLQKNLKFQVVEKLPKPVRTCGQKSFRGQGGFGSTGRV